MKISFGWVLIAFLADLLSLFLLSDAIGAGWAFMWVLGAIVLGVLVIMDAGDTLRSLGGIFATPSERVEAIKETPWMLLVGILLFIPGALSDFLAILLWLPVLRKRVLRPKSAGGAAAQSSHQQDDHAHAQAHRAHGQESVIIEGEFVEKPVGHLPPHH